MSASPNARQVHFKYMIPTRRQRTQTNRKTALICMLGILLPMVVILVSGLLSRGRGVLIDLLIHTDM